MLLHFVLIQHIDLAAKQMPQLRTNDLLLLRFGCFACRGSPTDSLTASVGCRRSACTSFGRRGRSFGTLSLANTGGWETMFPVYGFDRALESAVQALGTGQR